MRSYFIIITTILSFMVLQLNVAQSQNSLPLIKNFTPEEYSGGIQNWDIQQDKNGIIYIANNFGLLQFDGNTWRTYNISSASKLRSIALHSDGKIFAGCQGDFGYFEADSIGILKYHSLKNIIPSKFRDIDETWKVYVINDKVYFCTFSNIYIYDGKSILVVESDETLDVVHVSSNVLYPHIPGIGLHKLNSNQLELIPNGDFFKDKFISSVINTVNNNLLISTSRSGVFMVNENFILPWNEKLNHLFESSFINCTIVLKNGDIAFGTQHQGLYIIGQDGEVKLQLHKENGLNSRTILSLYEDQNNNLWVGENNGISFVELKSPFSLLNEESGLPGTGYAAVMQNDRLFLGTNNGVYVSEAEYLGQIEGSEGQVYNLQLINNEILMSQHNGAFKIEKNKTTKLSSGGTWMFLEAGNFLLKGGYLGIDILNKENYTPIGTIEDLNESSRIIVKENDSIIWMAHGYKGLYRIIYNPASINKARVEFYNQQNGLPSNLFNAVHIIEGELKICTERGIYNFDESSKSFYPDEVINQYLNESPISVLKNDIHGNIYFISTTNVGFLEKIRTHEYIKHDAEFNSIRKLLNDDLPNINIIGSNKVLFGAKEGFVHFDKNKFWTTDKEKFKTNIRQVQSKGDKSKLLYGGNGDYAIKVQDSDSDVENYPEIAYVDNTITFEFSSTTFSATTLPQFQYRLIGYERPWQEWTSNNFKEYTNLREGLYTFQVKSKNASNDESEIETYTFLIVYPWYRSPIAYIIYVIIVMFVIVSLLISLERKHEMDKKILEQKRVEELTEKEQELDHITRKSEEEISLLMNDKLESELKHKNTELATNTMHILNKNEFISGIKNTLTSVIKKSTNEEVKKQINVIIKNIDKNIQTDGDWDHFQIHFEQVHGDFSKRILTKYPDLSSQDIKLSAYLRLHLSTKEIANLLNISVRGVEIARYRLRKKLNLDRTQNLAEYILNF